MTTRTEGPLERNRDAEECTPGWLVLSVKEDPGEFIRVLIDEVRDGEDAQAVAEANAQFIIDSFDPRKKR
ncbi:MAG: hypothetical protein KGJ23_08585 [Euryarchaeota archaeon]|nr:hypothetical protein [Euryarchaeota archaeon]MDE1880312.1 hypothetical protein [Euryarchaeota archaeon]MDE2044629.1 hypothetical protein [Thermoplasmata archaeon]